MSKQKNNWLDDLPEAFKAYCAGRAIDEVECIVPDLAGMSRGKAMPVRKFHPQYETYLPVSIFYQTITGVDVEMDPGDAQRDCDCEASGQAIDLKGDQGCAHQNRNQDRPDQ